MYNISMPLLDPIIVLNIALESMIFVQLEVGVERFTATAILITHNYNLMKQLRADTRVVKIYTSS